VKKSNSQIWKIWVLGTIVAIASLFLLLLCIVSKPTSVNTTTVTEKKQQIETTPPPINDNIAQPTIVPQIKENISEQKEEAQIAETSVQTTVPIVSEHDNKSAIAKKKQSSFDIPLAQKNAKLVFIFDDAGQSISKLQKYTSLPFPFTVAVLPYLPHSRDCAAELSRKGKEIMLHQPMQAVNLSINPGPGAISPDMDSFAIEELLNRNIDSLGVKIAGMNNHEGSLITSDLVKMLAVLKVAQEKGIYFVDSRTTAATKVVQAGQLLGTRVFSNDVFLDNDVEREAILHQIYHGIEIANKNGRVVMIGHIDKSADIIPKLLSEMYPELIEKGYNFGILSAVK